VTEIGTKTLQGEHASTEQVDTKENLVEEENSLTEKEVVSIEEECFSSARKDNETEDKKIPPVPEEVNQ